MNKNMQNSRLCCLPVVDEEYLREKHEAGNCNYVCSFCDEIEEQLNKLHELGGCDLDCYICKEEKTHVLMNCDSDCKQ